MWTVTRQQERGGLRIVEVTNGEVGMNMLPAMSTLEYSQHETKETALKAAEHVCNLWIEDTKNQPGYVPQIKVIEVEEKQEEEKTLDFEIDEPQKTEEPPANESTVTEESCESQENVAESETTNTQSPPEEEEAPVEKPKRVRRNTKKEG